MAIKIFIDQGHNPHTVNAGAEGNGLREQDITYAVGMHLADLLTANPMFEVKVSRETPETILGTTVTESLSQRVEMAADWGANYFLSIHANASTNPEINGSEVYIYSEFSPAANLAQSILDSIVKDIGTKDNGIKINPTLYVLRKTTMPAALIELAYITNFEDSEKLKNNQLEFAYAIYAGILNSLN
ncbi:MAG: N-acetylmuramoyl-L-alanine amidase [Candidatus Improbicoccus devescovinae]|nr:MAG: N-acetylmuramoyl-L-alanine amidase [Candidatus Improbicoccus devescovinae]